MTISKLKRRLEAIRNFQPVTTIERRENKRAIKILKTAIRTLRAKA